MSGNLKSRLEGRLLRLTLSRPEKRNALHSELCTDLAAAVLAAETDQAVGAILLDAEGPVFCAGMDLEEALEPDAAERTAIHEDLFTLGRRYGKPIVAAVQGAALAGGLGLVANAHVAIAAQGTKFGVTEIRIGMWPFVIYRAVEGAVGERRALELSLTGRIFGATEAMQWGLIHEVVPAMELEDRAEAVARTIAYASPDALRFGMEFVRASREVGPKEAGELGATLRARLFRSPDFSEGVAAFREKRKPKWPSLPD